ncbi:MAG: hypothetical protein J5928_05735 [Firmicutes bacterium]|nr:hypothetical protein [Bacillota bacterium]
MSKKRLAFTGLYILSFMACLMVPLLFTNTKENVTSDFDNRQLVEFPDNSEEDFSKNVESYLRDRIGFRNEMVTAYQLLNAKLTGDMKHPLYTYGQDGYVFFNMKDNIEYGSYHQTFADAVLRMNEYCNTRGVKFYFVFSPEKSSVYRRYLPKGVNYNDEWVDELISYMESCGVTCVNNKELLTEKSFSEQVFNQQYDAGHWNDLGAFYGTNNLMKTINKDVPAVTEYLIDEFDVTTGIGDYLASSKFPIHEEIPVFTWKGEWSDQTRDYDGINLHNNYPYFQYLVNQEGGDGKYPRIMFFQGSYYNSRYKYLVGRTSEYIGIHDYQNVLDLDYYFNIFQPEIVVFEVAEYTFSDTYFDSSKMASIDYNPSLVKPGQEFDEAIKYAKSKAQTYSITEGQGLNIISGEGFDRVYFDGDLPQNARYAYVLTNGQVFDLKVDAAGVHSGGVPHGAIGDEATLYYEDIDGEKYYSSVKAFKAESFVKNVVCSGAASFDDVNNSCTFETDITGNRFSSFNLQLLDGETGEYLEAVFHADSKGKHLGYFLHTRKSGWYTIRFKGNTNLQDEYIDVSAYLYKGKRYCFFFDLALMDREKVVVENLEFVGPSSNN